MNKFEGVMEQYFWSLWGLCTLWVAFVMTLSIVYRVRKGKALFYFGDSSAIFLDRMASGRSCKNLLTRCIGANNCLAVTVTAQAIYICPVFPFNLMFLPELYDLEHHIPRMAVIQTRRLKRFLMNWIEIEYRDESGGSRIIQLHIRKADEFLRAAGFDCPPVAE